MSFPSRPASSLAVIALAAGLLGGSSASATSVVPLSLVELAREARVVQRARVAETATHTGPYMGHEAILTTLELERVQAYKGQGLARVRTFGGTLGGRTMTLIGQPRLRAGDEVFLFLDPNPRLPCPYVGIWQGVYLVREGGVYREGRPVRAVSEGTIVLGDAHERALGAAVFQKEVEAAIRRASVSRPARRDAQLERFDPPEPEHEHEHQETKQSSTQQARQSAAEDRR